MRRTKFDAATGFLDNAIGRNEHSLPLRRHDRAAAPPERVGDQDGGIHYKRRGRPLLALSAASCSARTASADQSVGSAPAAASAASSAAGSRRLPSAAARASAASRRPGSDGFS